MTTNNKKTEASFTTPASKPIAESKHMQPVQAITPIPSSQVDPRLFHHFVFMTLAFMGLCCIYPAWHDFFMAWKGFETAPASTMRLLNGLVFIGCVVVAWGVAVYCKQDVLYHVTGRIAFQVMGGVFLLSSQFDLLAFFLMGYSGGEWLSLDYPFYSLLLVSMGLFKGAPFLLVGKEKRSKTSSPFQLIVITLLLIGCLGVLLPIFSFLFQALPTVSIHLAQNFITTFALLGVVLHAKRNLTLKRWQHLLKLSSVLLGILFVMNILVTMKVSQFIGLKKNFSGLSLFEGITQDLSQWLKGSVPLIAGLMLSSLGVLYTKKKAFSEEALQEETSGNFGTAAFATAHELDKRDYFNTEKGLVMGMDDKDRLIHLPLCNKLTLAPAGMGKTTASSIPALLSYEGSVFVLDVKGELWAVTARYRSEVLKRKVVVIDPYNITQSESFMKGKPESLRKKYTLNPFDWIPEDESERDRMINTFSDSFIVRERTHHTNHFDDNAKILIRGYMDYLMSFPKAERNLATLFSLMTENLKQSLKTFEIMEELGGRAAVSANQIGRVGSDERGSIFSTAYRQIDWISDRNIQETLLHSNFDLREFLEGNMDIFVVLPEDQIKEHARLMRMLLAILIGMIVQCPPEKLPSQKMLFLLDELAQLGYCPDVEHCMEVLRGRGVVVWSVFQTLSQIEQFEKPDLFKGATLKQVFTNDDTKTMEWIQTLGGKRTIRTKTLSTNSGDSHQKMQVWGGSVSKGESESIHETGADLIQINEIRELPFDEQFLFYHGEKPIRCQKVFYFQHPFFKGKYDKNPVEIRK